MSKENKNNVDNQEDYTLKKIRYYQGTIDDYDSFWKKKIADSESEISSETKGFKKRNADLNRAFEIIPVEDESKKEEVCPECGKNPCECEKKEEKKEKKDKE